MKGLSIASIVLGVCGLIVMLTAEKQFDYDALLGWVLILGAFCFVSGILFLRKFK